MKTRKTVKILLANSQKVGKMASETFTIFIGKSRICGLQQLFWTPLCDNLSHPKSKPVVNSRYFMSVRCSYLRGPGHVPFGTGFLQTSVFKDIGLASATPK